MRKADYLLLAKKLRQDISVWSPSHGSKLGETHEEYIGRKYASITAANLARYLAQYLSVDRAAFLDACGLKP